MIINEKNVIGMRNDKDVKMKIKIKIKINIKKYIKKY